MTKTKRLRANRSTLQLCPICKKRQKRSERYPAYLCRSCEDLASDRAGRRLEFANLDISGGFQASYVDTGKSYASHVCYVNGIECWADEAHFGGIVVQVKTEPSVSE